MNNDDWIRVEDRLPIDYESVLIYGAAWDDKACHGWCDSIRWYDCDIPEDPIGDGDITHWQPLPDPPNDQPDKEL